MKLAGRIPVEPLDEERMTNLERRIVAGAVDAAIRGELRAPRRWLGGAVAALAIATAGVVGWALHTAPPSAPVAGDAAPLRVQAAAQGSVIDIGDARIASDPGAAFEVTRPDGGVLIAIARGKLALEVDKRGDRAPLVVRAGDTDVVVVGTRFSVDYGDGRGEVDVQVTEGVVRVVHLQQATRVAVGQAWRTRSGLIALADAPRGAPPESASPARRDAPTAPLEAASDRPGAPRDRAAAAPEVLHDRKAAVPEATSAAAPPAPRTAATRPGSGEPARTRTPVRDDPHIDLKAAIRVQRVEPALELPDASGAAAVARYYDIAAHRSGDEASRAFYSIAAVKYFRLGSADDALQTLDAYVRRFPGGKEYRAALWLRVRILCLDRFDDRCRAAAYTYLHEAADDPASHVAELLTQTQ